MKVDVYKGRNRPRKDVTVHLFVESEEDPISKVPAEALAELGELDKIKELDLEEGQTRIGLDTNQALKNLKEQGYHIQSSEFVIRFTHDRNEGAPAL